MADYRKLEANLKALCRLLKEDEENYYLELREKANRKVNIAIDPDPEEELYA